MLSATPDDATTTMDIDHLLLPTVSDHLDFSQHQDDDEEEEEEEQVCSKQVQFDETAMYIEPTRDPISREDKKVEWYTQKDFINFDKESRKLILRAKQLISGNQLDVIKMEDICLRGLEANFSTRAFMNRNARQNHALHTVLNEQNRQRYENDNNNNMMDEDLIRELYMLQTHQAVKLAIDLARQDAEAVIRDNLSQEQEEEEQQTSTTTTTSSAEKSASMISPKKRRSTISNVDHFPLSPTRRPRFIASPRARSRRLLQPQLRMDRDSFAEPPHHQASAAATTPVYQVTNQFAPGVTVNMQTRTIVLDTSVSSSTSTFLQR